MKQGLVEQGVYRGHENSHLEWPGHTALVNPNLILDDHTPAWREGHQHPGRARIMQSVPASCLKYALTAKNLWTHELAVASCFTWEPLQAKSGMTLPVRS